jgi:phosphotriesterase-related protein
VNHVQLLHRRRLTEQEKHRAFTALFDHVTNVRIYGGHTIFDGVTDYEGRDYQLLEQVSRATGVRIVTNTGFTAVEDGRFLPSFVKTEPVGKLVEYCLNEWNEGFEKSGIRPGYFKLGFDLTSSASLIEKLCTVAAQVHLECGLSIASDTPSAAIAQMQLDALKANGVSPNAWIWLHAQREAETQRLVAIAKNGAWIQIDDFSATTIESRLQLIRALHVQGLVQRILVSQYTSGVVAGATTHGGNIQRLDRIFKLLIPELFRDDFLLAQIRQMTVTNPSRAYMTCVRRFHGGAHSDAMAEELEKPSPKSQPYAKGETA